MGLQSCLEELPSPPNEVADIPREMLFRLDEVAVEAEAVGIDKDCSAELEASELLSVAEKLWPITSSML